MIERTQVRNHTRAVIQDACEKIITKDNLKREQIYDEVLLESPCANAHRWEPYTSSDKGSAGKMLYNGNTTENVNVEPPLRYM